MHGRGVRGIAVLLVGLAGVLAPGGAFTEESSRPWTGEVAAVFRVLHDPADDEVVECEGEDGTYEEIREHSTGTILSTDERLTGDLDAFVWLLLNRTTFKGTLQVDVEVRDPATKALKFSGVSYIALEYPAMRGILLGETADGTRVIAGISLVHDPPSEDPHYATGEIGGPAVPVDLAMMQRGSCSEAAAG